MLTFTRRAAVQATLASAAAGWPGIPMAAHDGARQYPPGGDLGHGWYRNPIVAGDRPDPTILKDGADYYLSFSSFTSYPGAVIWHSTDLVNWAPVVAALHRPIGAVWAMDLVKHDGRYFLYIPAMQDDGSRIYVIHAENIRGPWSEPIDLHLPGCIDPGHAVGEDGRRYLFVNGVRRIALAPDGLSTVGELEPAATPWQYPKDWVVEMFAPEGPKLFRRGDWFYMIAAVGGTSGPPTSHMVTLARSRSIHGPWEDCPHNPIVRTRSADEPWWSRGHASVVEGPAGDWWMVYHGYANGMRTLGRQTLMEPVEWTPDGWLKARGGTLDRALPAPKGGKPSPAGPDLSDDFSHDRMGIQWTLFGADAQDPPRVALRDRSLVLQAKGSTLADCSPLTCLVGDRSYEASVELAIDGPAQGGLALFYDGRGFVGVGANATEMLTFNYGQEIRWMRQPLPAQTGPRVMHVRVANRENVVTFHTSSDGVQWTQHPWQMEVSGLHHNVFGGFLSLKLALFSAGQGQVRFRRFRYRRLTA